MDNVLKVLVVSMGAPDPEGDKLRHELSLVRSAALYADQVTLMSAGAELLMGYQDMLANADDESVWQLLGRAPELRDQVGRLPDVSAALQEIAERIRRSDGIWRDEYQEFDLGRQAGVVKIEPFTSGAWTQREEDGEDGSRFLARLGDLLNQPEYHALLDTRAAEYARALRRVDPNALSASSHRRARLAEVGAGMIARLPAFPSAPLDELLDVKRELTPALVR